MTSSTGLPIVAASQEAENRSIGHRIHALRGKFTLEPYRSALLLTQPRPLAKDSPSDFVWSARGAEGGYGGQNLLGLALMRVRDELIADVRTRLSALAPGR